MADASSDDGRRRDLLRPALAGGEQFLSPADMAGPLVNDDGWRPQPEWEVPTKLGHRIATVIDGRQELIPARDGRIVFEAQLMPNFLSASSWPSKLFEATGLTPVGTRLSRTDWITRSETKHDIETKTVLLSGDSEGLQQLATVISKPDSEARERGLVDEVARFDDLRLPSSAVLFRDSNGEVRREPGGEALMESVLHPQLDRDGTVVPDAMEAILADWSALVRELGGDVNAEFVREQQGLQFVPLILPLDGVSHALRFSQLRVMRLAPQIRDPPRPMGRSRPQIPTPSSQATGDRRIAVFDGGVDLAAPGLTDVVTDEDLTGGTLVLPEFLEHGTAVCSAVLYGHVDPGTARSIPHAGVDHFRVWPPPAGHRHDADLAWVLARIEEVIGRGEHRLVVISLAPNLSIEDHEPHDWTVTLDRLALEHDVLFIIAAGNTGDLAPSVNRLLVPADAVNGLSVGACTTSTGTVVVADYSSRGPGRPGGRTAPNGVQFGGDLPDAPFYALALEGELAEFEGTSFAAPVVARGLAELDLAIDRQASANLLRTIAVHHAESPTATQRQVSGSTTSDVGYGRFRDSYAAHLDHAANSVTIVSEATIVRKEQLTIPFVLPSEVFAEHATQKFLVRWTLGFFGPVEPSNIADYSCSGLRVVFRPHADRFTLFPPDSESLSPIKVNRVTEPTVIDTMVDGNGWRLSRRPESSEKRGYAPEVQQRARDGKWETIVRMERSMTGASLHEPCIDVHMLGREAGTLADTEALGFAFVLTVVAPSDCQLYDRTRVNAPTLVPLTTSVPITVQARV
jgi:hypothetical protein